MAPGSSSRALNALALVGFLVPVAAAFWFINHFALDITYYDQWTDVALIRRADSGTLSFGALWAQHNENRILFPNLLVLVLAATAHFNIVVEDYLSGIAMTATAGLLIVAHRRRQPGLSWLWYCPVALVLLSFVPLADALFGYQVSWFFALVALAGSLSLADRRSGSWLSLCGAVVVAVIGSYSSLEGLFIWVAVLALLVLRRRPRTQIVAWIGAAAVTATFYLVNFDFSASGGSASYTISHLGATIRYFFSIIGDVISAPIGTSPGAGSDTDLVLGVVVFAVALWSVVRVAVRNRSGGGPIGVALISFGLLFAAASAVGRTRLGLASAGRFSIFVLTIWVGAYLALLDPAPGRVLRWWWHRAVGAVPRPPSRPPERSRKVGAVLLTVFLGLLVVQVGYSYHRGLADGRSWHSEETTIADVTANIGQSSNPIVQDQLGAYPAAFMRQMAGFERSRRLNLFSTAEAAHYRRLGLFAHLFVEVVRPSDGAVVSGSALLDASVGEPASTVQFVLTGGMLHQTVIGIGRQTIYGWIGLWDTATVPNGTYLLRARSVLAGGSMVSSSPVSIHVRNRSSM
ncbi:MAG: hypothetical protein ACYDDZ_02810 [Acidimicrobiales bacterium]